VYFLEIILAVIEMSECLTFFPVTFPNVGVPKDIENYFSVSFMEKRWGYTGLDYPFR